MHALAHYLLISVHVKPINILLDTLEHLRRYKPDLSHSANEKSLARRIVREGRCQKATRGYSPMKR